MTRDGEALRSDGRLAGIGLLAIGETMLFAALVSALLVLMSGNPAVAAGASYVPVPNVVFASALVAVAAVLLVVRRNALGSSAAVIAAMLLAGAVGVEIVQLVQLRTLIPVSNFVALYLLTSVPLIVHGAALVLVLAIGPSRWRSSSIFMTAVLALLWAAVHAVFVLAGR